MTGIISPFDLPTEKPNFFPEEEKQLNLNTPLSPNFWDEEEEEEDPQKVQDELDKLANPTPETEEEPDGEEPDEEEEEEEEEEEPDKKTEPEEEESDAYIQAMSLVEEGILTEDQVTKDIDLLTVRDLLVQNTVGALDKQYNVDQRVEQLAAQRGYTKQNKEYLDYLIAGGSESNVIAAAKIDNFLSIDLTDPDLPEEKVDELIAFALKQKGNDPDTIPFTIKGIKDKDEVEKYAKASQSYLKSERTRIIDEDKRVKQEAAEAQQAQVDAYSNAFKDAVVAGQIGDKKLDISTTQKFKEAVYAKTETIETANGKQKVSRIDKILFESQNDPKKLAELYYQILFNEKEVKEKVEEGKANFSKKLINMSQGKAKSTKTTTKAPKKSFVSLTS